VPSTVANVNEPVTGAGRESVTSARRNLEPPVPSTMVGATESVAISGASLLRMVTVASPFPIVPLVALLR
jgi:hypothetical protein